MLRTTGTTSVNVWPPRGRSALARCRPSCRSTFDNCVVQTLMAHAGCFDFIKRILFTGARLEQRFFSAYLKVLNFTFLWDHVKYLSISYLNYSSPIFRLL